MGCRRLLLSSFLAMAAATAHAQVLSECPKLEILGPSGLTTPGDLAVFSLKPTFPNADKLQIKWEVSLGTIEEGQGNAKIAVRADADKQVYALTATVTITSLPEGCPYSVSETVGVAGNIDYFPIDEYGRLPLNDERGRLDIALAEVKARPSFDLLIFLHAPKSASQVSVAARKKRIERHVIRDRKFAATRIHFVRRDSEQIWTQIYMLPRELVETFIWKEDTVLL